MSVTVEPGGTSTRCVATTRERSTFRRVCLISTTTSSPSRSASIRFRTTTSDRRTGASLRPTSFDSTGPAPARSRPPTARAKSAGASSARGSASGATSKARKPSSSSPSSSASSKAATSRSSTSSTRTGATGVSTWSSSMGAGASSVAIPGPSRASKRSFLARPSPAHRPAGAAPSGFGREVLGAGFRANLGGSGSAVTARGAAGAGAGAERGGAILVELARDRPLLGLPPGLLLPLGPDLPGPGVLRPIPGLAHPVRALRGSLGHQPPQGLPGRDPLVVRDLAGLAGLGQDLGDPARPARRRTPARRHPGPHRRPGSPRRRRPAPPTG